MKVLVVYYSRSGNTREVAKKLSEELNCDLEEIYDTQSRSGIIGFLKSAYQSIKEHDTILKPYNMDPSNYDLVVIGTPIWAGKPSVPIRTYLKENRNKIKSAAFFYTYGGSGLESSIKSMTDLLGKEPVETMAITQNEIKENKCDCKIEPFVRDITQ